MTKRTSAKKGPSAATLKYVRVSSRTTLGEGLDGVTIEEEDGVSKFYCKGVEYATCRFDGDMVVIAARKPDPIGDLEPKLVHWAETERPGWLTVSLPLTRDPRPWLDAAVGMVVGVTRRQLWEG